MTVKHSTLPIKRQMTRLALPVIFLLLSGVLAAQAAAAPPAATLPVADPSAAKPHDDRRSQRPGSPGDQQGNKELGPSVVHALRVHRDHGLGRIAQPQGEPDRDDPDPTSRM